MSLKVYNTKNQKKEDFIPVHEGNVGMYVCGPTVYNDVHIGNCRTFISFDLIYRYLLHLGFKVRYVRNITDVGHLENDSDDGDDKIAKKAKLENLEPMEIVQKYTNGFHDMMQLFNTLPPSIEPTATGHLIEQIEMVETIIQNGFGYEVNGSVYFDVKKFAEKFGYGELSGRKIDELQNNTRELTGGEEKRNSLDFVIWKKADPKHIMQWNSPWGKGFPGWHLECSAMSTKYLGEEFDIHGGGMDLKFPHHECEIAQNVAVTGKKDPIKYWLHANMLTLNGEKMSKSTGQFFLPQQLFDGTSKFFTKAYSPMAVKFFMMQSHYRSTLDISNEALEASEKGMERLVNAYHLLGNLKESDSTDYDAKDLQNKCYDAMNDDFNSPMVIAHLFDAVKYINSVNDGSKKINSETKSLLQNIFNNFLVQIMGLKMDLNQKEVNGIEEDLMQIIIDIRKNAKINKDFATADKIRAELERLQIVLKDSKEGTTYEKN